MKHVINIRNSGQEVDLEIGKYKIDVLGGWGVNLGQFSISFIHKKSGQIINCKRSSLQIQTLEFGKRAKRIFSVEIVERGTYKIEFENAEALQVKETNLFFIGLFQSPISNDRISILIH